MADIPDLLTLPTLCKNFVNTDNKNKTKQKTTKFNISPFHPTLTLI